MREGRGKGVIRARNGARRVGDALVGHAVAVRAPDTGGVHAVFLCRQRVATVDLTHAP